MALDNTTTLVGNMTRDAELRFTPGGQAVASFGLAVNRRWQNRQTQEWEEQVSFFDVTAWGALGENIAASAYRGDRVVVTGRLEQDNWEAEDGTKRSKIKVVADEVALSLKWITVPEIVKNEKPEGQSGGRPQQSGGRPQQSSGSGGRQAPAQQSYSDEEPF